MINVRIITRAVSNIIEMSTLTTNATEKQSSIADEMNRNFVTY